MKYNNKPILIAIDLEDKSLPLLRHSYPNLKALGDNIILLYVFNRRHHFDTKEGKEKETAKKSQQLSAIANEITEQTGLNVQHILQIGRPSTEILKAAESYNATMIIMSTRTQFDDGSAENDMLGSTTARVVRQSKIAVFTFNSNVKLKPIKRILLPLDLTNETKQKVTNAIEIAQRFGAEIQVVSAFWSVEDKIIKKELLIQLNRIKDFIAEDEIPCTAELIEIDGGKSDLSYTILHYADQNKSDLIMIMTQQETKMAEFFMGSAAQSILRLAQIPVMSIIPKNLG
jgi:nucleotide-binding universal stress UspA family protein